MAILAAENHFRKGLVALHQGNYEAASSHLRSAIRIEQQRSVTRPQMRYLSYYGLSVALLKGAPTHEAIHACENAARLDFYNPDLQLNLARVYLLAGKLTHALAAFERGLALAPDHKVLRSELARVERRRRPAIPWLGRAHPINRWIGIARASLRSSYPRWSPFRRTVTPS